MIDGKEKLGVFIVPTGIGASIGGYAGDASSWARKFSKYSKLIVNPNVVNAGGFSGINNNMLYVEGYMLNEFIAGNIELLPSENSIGIVFDKSIPPDVLNIHINTFNAVKTVYGIEIKGYEITEEAVGVDFTLDKSGVSNGSVQNPTTILNAAKKLLSKGCEAIAIVCLFDDPENYNINYSNGIGTDPVGGVEAILSHYISQKLQVPCAHSPAFEDYQIFPELVNPKAASEYITPTFLPCILLGLAQAPQFVKSGGISADSIDYIVMPYNSLGSPAVLDAIENNIKVYGIKENSTALSITADKLGFDNKIHIIDTYEQCLMDIINS